MPDGDDYDGGIRDFVEEPIRRNDDLSVRTLWEFRNQTARLGELLEPSQSLLDTASKPVGRGRVVTSNVGERGAELIASRSRKVDVQSVSPARNLSASAITSSRL